MSYITVSPLPNTTIMRIYSEKDEIQIDPDYQRLGGIWTLSKRQLLIDSILNDYDIPKIYFHDLGREYKKQHGISYAVIDGRQRLETIWDFIEGKFCIADDFFYQDDETINLSGLGYDDIAKSFPRIRIKFDSFVLPIVGVATDDPELIEDMFSRLNEAVPLNAAEKRNAFGGNMVKLIREISQHHFFSECVKFGNSRYKHYEIATRILFVENSLIFDRKIIDTKKEYLDSFVMQNKDVNENHEKIKVEVSETLNALYTVFNSKDELLSSQGNMVVYYLLFRTARLKNELSKISRDTLISFKEAISRNRELASKDITIAKFEFLEYDKLTQQGTNDASNIKERLRILIDYFGITSDAIILA